MSPYRLKAQQVIADVVAANPGADNKTLRKRMSKAYPFGERAHWPYVVWCNCVREYFEGPKKKEKWVEEIKEGGLFGDMDTKKDAT